MEYKMVFCDVDGTLLNSAHEILPGTLKAIGELQRKGIPFVIASGRSPSGIYPILEENCLKCPIISYSGALIMDENRKILCSTELSKKLSADIVAYIEYEFPECCLNIFSMDSWIVKDKSDPRVICEENIVRADATEGTLDTLEKNAGINKILCMCSSGQILDMEKRLRSAFPGLSIAKSSDVLLEIMQRYVTKGNAIRKLCGLWNIPVESTVAFGDHFNDAEMLETVGLPFLMGNAPSELKKRFHNIAPDNDSEGIYHALVQAGLI